MDLFKWFRSSNRLSLLVAEKLMGVDVRDQFTNRVARSMKEHPDEWEVSKLKATHKSGVVVDANDYNKNFGEVGQIPDQIRAWITEPTYLLCTNEEVEVLGDAFDYLAKVKILEKLNMDRV